jgi:hypothetical protein
MEPRNRVYYIDKFLLGQRLPWALLSFQLKHLKKVSWELAIMENKRLNSQTVSTKNTVHIIDKRQDQMRAEN